MSMYLTVKFWTWKSTYCKSTTISLTFWTSHDLKTGLKSMKQVLKCISSMWRLSSCKFWKISFYLVFRNEWTLPFFITDGITAGWTLLTYTNDFSCKHKNYLQAQKPRSQYQSTIFLLLQPLKLGPTLCACARPLILPSLQTVSYTHLTLPTTAEV